MASLELGQVEVKLVDGNKEAPKSSKWQQWVIWFVMFATGVGGNASYNSYNAYHEVSGNAEVVVKQPDGPVRVGQLVQLDASESYADALKWVASPELTADNFQLLDGGKKAFFSAEKPGTYTFWIAAAADKTVDLRKITVQVDGVKPPDPDVNSLELSLRVWMLTIKGDTWRQEAKQVASSFRTVAQQIESGILKRPEDVIAATTIGNRAAVGNSGPAWQSFGQDLRKYLNEESKDGKLASMTDHSRLWFQIANAMEKIANEGHK